jgi:hypothetical protein
MKHQPLILGGLCLLLGYSSAWALRKPSPVPAALRAFHRQEQMARLRRLAIRR